MILLIQIVNRMISLGYTKEGAAHYISLVRDGKISAETLFTIMDCEVPKRHAIDRFYKALCKADSVIHITFQEDL